MRVEAVTCGHDGKSTEGDDQTSRELHRKARRDVVTVRLTRRKPTNESSSRQFDWLYQILWLSELQRQAFIDRNSNTISNAEVNGRLERNRSG